MRYMANETGSGNHRATTKADLGFSARRKSYRDTNLEQHARRPHDPTDNLQVLLRSSLVLGSALVWLGCRRQAVLAVDVDHPAGDGEAHEGAHDVVLDMALSQGLDDSLLVARAAVAEKLEDGGSCARDHGVGIGGGGEAERHGNPVAVDTAAGR